MNATDEFVQRMRAARTGSPPPRRGVATEPRRIRIPPGGFKPEATPAEVLEVACPLCEAPAGEPCDRGKYRFSLLGLAFPKQGYSSHTYRYLRRVRGEDWKR